MLSRSRCVLQLYQAIAENQTDTILINHSVDNSSSTNNCLLATETLKSTERSTATKKTNTNMENTSTILEIALANSFLMDNDWNVDLLRKLLILHVITLRF